MVCKAVDVVVLKALSDDKRFPLKSMYIIFWATYHDIFLVNSRKMESLKFRHERRSSGLFITNMILYLP